MRTELSSIGRLAWPNLLSFGAQLAIAAVDGAVAAAMGPKELAVVAVTLPIQMLLIQTGNGAFGAATAGSVARAIGARDNLALSKAVTHAILLAFVTSLLIAIAGLVFSKQLITAIGGSDGVLQMAMSYVGVLFGAGIAIWLNGALAGIVRGARRMWLPAGSLLGGALLHAVLGPALAFGYAGLPELGLLGLGISLVISYCVTLVPLSAAVLRSKMILSLSGFRWDAGVLRVMLRTAGLAVLSVTLSNLAVMWSTRLVSTQGADALAGYGLGARLEYVLVPLAFAIGTALVTLCGQARGAGNAELARRYVVAGVSASALMLGTVGVIAAVAPDLWLRWFHAGDAVTAAGASYLGVAGFAYAFFGAGLTAFFGSQAFGDMRRPLIGATLRILVIAGGGVLALQMADPAIALYLVFALGLVVYGINNVLAILYVSAVGPDGRARN